MSTSRCAVEGDFAVHHDRNVATWREELHDALPRTGELRPARLSIGILFEAAQFLSFEIEIHLAQSALGRPAHGVFMVLQLDHGCPFEQRLAPNGNESFLEGHQVLAF